jgi:hypothetical protein
MADGTFSNKDGRPGIVSTVGLLRRIAAECDRQKGNVPALGKTGRKARAQAQALEDADQRKLAALAGLKHAHRDACSAYDDAVDLTQRLRAQLFALLGHDAEALARYGVRTPYRPRKRIVPLAPASSSTTAPPTAATTSPAPITHPVATKGA